MNMKQRTLEEIIRSEQEHRTEGGIFGITECKDSIRTAVDLFGRTLGDLLAEYVERANSDVFFNKAMVLACYELMQEEEQAKEEPKEGEEMTYTEIVEKMQNSDMIPVSVLYDETQHTEEGGNVCEGCRYADACGDADRVEPCEGFAEEEQETAETPQEKQDRENFEHCRRIAQEVEEVAEGVIYKCPHCGELYNIEEAEETEEGHTCPNCSEEVEESEAEQVTIWDYFNDAFDIEYRISGSGDFRSCRLMVACGGPNIYVDTDTSSVELYWWGDRASAGFDRDAAALIDEAFEELYTCTR